MKNKLNWPDGKKFAFTIFDDTDFTTMQNGPPIYDFLYSLGVLTTKSVWPIKGEYVPLVGGSTCEEPEYLKWVLQLQEQGFEIALHNVTYHTSRREQVIVGLDKFKEYFGTFPKVHTNHAGCSDSVYWGDSRLSGTNRFAYNCLTRFQKHKRFMGDEVSNDLFWGDRCKQSIKYVRNFVYSDINTLKACPYMPYVDPDRPFVNYWFASSEGPNCDVFCKTISEKNQEDLEREGGACIMYTHFGASDFYKDGKLNSTFTHLMEKLSDRAGWFVPVSVLLDYILKVKGSHVLTPRERFSLEIKWLMEKVFLTGGTS